LLIQKNKDTAAARRLLGERLLLHDLCPERKVFHISEVLNYYQAAVLLLLEEENIEAAEERHGILLAIAPEHDITESATNFILSKRMIANMQRMKEEQRNKCNAKTHVTDPFATIYAGKICVTLR